MLFCRLSKLKEGAFFVFEAVIGYFFPNHGTPSIYKKTTGEVLKGQQCRMPGMMRWLFAAKQISTHLSRYEKSIAY